MPPSRQQLQAVLRQHSVWLNQLRWVASLESWLALLALTLAAVNGLGAIWQSHSVWDGRTALSHLLLLSAIATCAPRRLATPLLGTLCLSLVNYAVLLLTRPPQLAVINHVYWGTGLVAGVAVLLVLPKLQLKWQAIGKYASQDDFRWLLTEAPLALRRHMAVELRAVASSAPDSGIPPAAPAA